MSVPFEAVPEGLTRQIKKVSAYRKNVAKVQINTAAIANPTDTIEIQLPTKGIIDFNDLIFQATLALSVTGVGGTANLPEPEEFFRRVTLECDGATIVDIDYYNDIFCLYKNATCSTPHARMRSCYSNDAFGLKRRMDCVDFSATGGPAITTMSLYNAAPETRPRPADPSVATAGFALREVYEQLLNGATPRLNACVFLGIQDLGYIDASVFPSMRLKLQLANNNILGLDGTATAASYSLSSMTLLVPQIILPAYTNSLLQLLAPDQNGNSETLYYKFRRYLPYIFASNAANLNSLKFSLSTSSLDRVWLTLKGSTFATQAAVTPGDCINYFKMAGNDTNTANCQIQYITVNIDNEALDGGVRDDLTVNGFIRNLQELSVLNNTQYDNLVDSNSNTAIANNTFIRSEFKRYKWFYVKSLKYEGDNTAMSGYNCMGSLANIQIDVEFQAAPGANLTFIVIAECSALLAVSAGRQVSVIL